MSYRRSRAVNSNRSDAALRPGLAERRYRDTGRAGPVSLERVHDFGHSPALRKALAGTTALTAAAVCGYLLSSDLALALPTDGTVVEGQAEIIYGDNSVTIQQGSDRVIIEWQTFDIDVHESVNFVQPHALAAALNRVLSGDASQILGSLTADGQVIISNPAGVVFGPEANVDVQSIVATSLNIMNRPFMDSGRLDFQVSGLVEEGVQRRDAALDSMVVNQGDVRADEMVAFVAPGVSNTGLIVAEVAIMGAGEAAVLDYYGDGLINFAITSPTTMLPIHTDGTAAEALVVNGEGGTILADGGQVILTADAAAGVVDNVINLDGVVVARRIESQGGQVALVGGDEGSVVVAGTIDASGVEEDDEGGTVHVLGETVVLADGASIDVSGPAGGGTVLVGGAVQGGPLAAGGHIAYSQLEPGAGGGTNISIDVTTAFETESYMPTADIAYVAEGAEVSADAETDGDGGTIVVWGDEAGFLYGELTAEGGEEGGDGGFIEFSSPGYLDFDGTVSTAAANGALGTFMIDPTDVVILLGSADGDDVNNGRVDEATILAGGTVGFGDGPANPFLIYESEIEGTNSNIIIQATRSIGVSENGQGPGTIVLSNNRSLTLETRNNTGDGAGGIDLTGTAFCGSCVGDLAGLTDQQVAFAVQDSPGGEANIEITASSLGEETGDIILGELSTERGGITVRTGRGSIVSTASVVTGAGGHILMTTDNIGAGVNGGDIIVEGLLETGSLLFFSNTTAGDVVLTAAEDIQVTATGGIDTDRGGNTGFRRGRDGDILLNAGVTVGEEGAGPIIDPAAEIDLDAEINAGSDNVEANAGIVRLAANIRASSDNISGTATQVFVESDAAEIQDGIDVASDEGVVASDVVVNVADGTYDLDSDGVVIDKNLSLIGVTGDPEVPGAGSPLLQGDGTGFGMEVEAPATNVEIAGFHIDNYADGIHADIGDGTPTAGSVIDINNNTITNTTSDGIFVDEFASVTIEYNDILVEDGDGVEIEDFDDLTAHVTGNVIGSETAGVVDGNGILIDDEGDATDMSVFIRQNSVSGFAEGIDFTSTEDGGASIQALVEQNVISGNTVGIQIDGDFDPPGTSNDEFAVDASNITVFNNDLSGNADFAVQHNGDGVLDASGNWWGTNNEADVLAETSGLVDITPFLDVGTDTDAGTLGFQGDFTVLNVTTLGEQTDPGLDPGTFGAFDATDNQLRINEAIQLVSGSTVQVWDGNYVENVLINIDGLSLLGGFDSPTTRLGTSTINPFDDTAPVILITNSAGNPETLVDLFTIDGDGTGFGVDAEDIRGLTLSNLNISETSDAAIRVVVDHQPTPGDSTTSITDNTIDGSNTGDGIEIAGDGRGQGGDELVGATVNITGNTIGEDGDDIDGRGIVFTTDIGDPDGDLALGSDSGDETDVAILIEDNDVFSAGNALEFSGEIGDIGGIQDIVIAITGNNAGFNSTAGHGIYFGGPIFNTDLDIFGNLIDAGLDGIHFAGAITDSSNIGIGDGSAGNTNTIVADNSGVVFAGSILGRNSVFLSRNVITAGPSLGDRGVEFRDGIGGSSAVSVQFNTINAGDDGVAFYDLNGGANGSGVEAISGMSDVIVAFNTIGSAGTPVGQEGLDFDEITDTADVLIHNNTIYAARDGMQFDRLIDSTGSGTIVRPNGLDYSGAVVVVNNDVSAGRNGALFDNTIGGADIAFGENDWGTDADPVGGDGVQFGTIAGDATVSFEREHIDADGDGVSVVGGILDTASLEFREARPGTPADGRDTDIDAGGIAVNVVNLQSPSTLSYAGGSFTGGAVAVNVDNTGLPAGTAGTVEFSGAPAFDVTDADGTVAQFLTDDTGPGINIDFGTSTASFTGGEDGMVFSGPGIDILGGGAGFSGSLGSISFTGQTDQYVSLTDGAEFDAGTGLPNLIDVTGVTFDGQTPGVLSLVDLVGLESKLFHFLDGPELDGDQNGLFYYGPTLAVTEGNSIQLAVNTVEIIRNAGLTAGQVAVGSGTFGGSVELWVDNLKVTGVDTGDGSPVIDTDAVDPFANQGDFDNGFYIADIGAIGDGSLNAVTSGSAANGNDVENVTIDPFVFAGSGPTSLIGSDVGVQLGAAGSTAINAVVDGNAFYDLNYGIVSVNTAGNTRLINNVMRRIAFDGIQFQDGIGSNEVLEILNNSIGAGDHGIALLGAIGSNADVDIHDNRILANQNEDATGAGIYFGGTIGGTIGGTATVNIGDGDRYSGTASNIITVAGNSGGDDVSGLDGIHFADDVGGEADIVIDGNRIGYTPPATSGGDRAPVADDGIEFHGDVEGDVDVTITDNWIRAQDDGIQFSARVRQNAEVLIGGGSYNYNFISAGDVGILFGGAVRNSAGTDSEIEISYNDIYGDDGIVFEGRVSGEGHDTLIAHNHNIVGRDGDGIRFDRAIDDAEVRILDNNDGIYATDDGIELAGGLTGTAYVAIARNNIRADEDGVLVDGEGVSDRSHLAIVDNNIGFYTDRIGENGIDIQSVTNRASVWIAYNDIYSYGSAIQFDGPITTRSRYIDWTGFYPGEFGVGIFGNTHINSYYGDGIEFSGPVEGGERSVRILIAENNHGIDAGQHGITFDSLVDNAYIRIAANDIEAGLYDGIGDGIHFGGEIWYSTIDIGSVFEDYGNEIDAYGDGIDFDERVRYSDVYIENNDINYGSAPGERGIEFDNGVYASNVYIIDNEILEEDWEWRRNDYGRWYRHYFVGDDGILFNDGEYSGQQSIDGESYVVISGNQIGSEYRPVGQNADETDGGSGVDIQSVADYSTVEISYNDIYAQDNAVQFDGTVEDSWVDVSWNEHLVGYDRHGVTFEGAVRNSYVDILGNNHGIFAGQNGINFGGVVSWSDIWIAGNIIQAGETSPYDGDGIHFDGEIWHSWIGIGGPLPFMGNEIDANGDGIDFDERVRYSTVAIKNNDIDYGTGEGERGIEFDNGVYDSDVYVWWNLILEDDYEYTGDDGILFNAGEYEGQAAIDGDSYVSILGNQIGSEYLPVGQNSDEDLDGDYNNGGAGIDIDNVSENAYLDIGYNWIYGEDYGIQFDGGSPAVEDNAVVRIADNFRVIGFNEDGIQFREDITDNGLVIIRDNSWIRGGDDGIEFNGRILGDATVRILDNRRIIGLDDEGIEFSTIRGNARVVVAGNHLIRGGDNGIDFDGTIRQNAIVRVLDNHRILGLGEDGMEFGSIRGNALVRIARNDLIRGYDTGIDFNGTIRQNAVVRVVNNDRIIGRNDEGIEFSTIRGDARVVIAWNDLIRGYDSGIDFDGRIRDNALIRIADNGRIIGRHENGIEFSRSVGDYSVVRIVRNDLIRGYDNGIEFEAPVQDAANVRIARNEHIVGRYEDGISFNGVFDYETYVRIVNNTLIEGYENGIHFASVPWYGYGPLSSYGLYGADPSIWGAQVAIIDNDEIVGHHRNGILVEGIRGDGAPMDYGVGSRYGLPASLFGYDQAHLEITGNGSITGYTNGVKIARVLNHDIGYGPFGFGGSLSAWAVEDAIVRIALNNTIEGETRNGILIQGIRSTTFDHGFPGNQVALIDEPGYEEWEPSQTIVDIYGNTEILGANNGIKLARGFDLGFDVFREFDIRTLGAVAALADADGIDGFGDWLFSIDGIYVDLSAWALQDATTRIAHNDLIRGGVPADSGGAVTTAETDDEGLISGNNGILVQGVRNTGYGPIYDDPSLGTAEEAVDHPSYRGAGSNLEIVANGTIEGYNNGVRLARGLTAEAYLDFGEYYHLSIDAWAIQNASAVIGYNGLISGQNRDGIQVQGVSEGFSRNGSASVSFINGFDNGIDLLIIENEEISGYDDGIDLQRGLSAALDVYVEPGVLSLSDQLRADPYTPISTPRSGNGTFNLTSMGRMTVDGVEYTVWRLRNETDTDEPATLRAAGGPVVFDGIVPANSDLFVASPVTGGAATHIVSFTDAEFSRTKASDTRDFQYGTSTPPSFDAFLSADAWAIDGAEVEISGNPTITGTDGDGIFVGGVRDQFYSYGEYDNLLITENGLIEGYWDGIRLGRGLSASASLSADIYYEEGDDRERLPVGAGLTQIDLAGDVDPGSLGGEWFDDVELDVHSASLNLDIWAIDYATVTISENETIQGLAGDGIFVGGVRDGITSPEDRDNLTIFSNTDILGGRDGIHFGQGLSFWLSYESEEELEPQVSAASLFSGGFGSGHEGLSYGLTVASIYDANVVIDLNGTAEQLGEVYDPISGDTILVDLDEFTVTGKVSGGDDGIDFAGLIGGDSTVTVSRNMVTESGDNGIEVGQVGDTFIPVPVSFEVDFPFSSFGGAPLNGGNTINGQAASSLRNPTSETVTFTAVTETGLTIEVEVPPESWVLVPTAELEGFSNVDWFVDGERVGGGSYLNNVPYVPGEFDVAVLSEPEGPVATLNIFNNFVMDNGLSLEEIDETFAAETAALQSGLGDYRYYDEGTLHGDGIHFEGDISPNGLVQVYQNYLTENAGDGVGVGSDFSSEEPTEPPITSPSFLSFYGDDDGIVDIGEPVVDEEGNPVSGLFININFMPGNGPDGPIDLEFSNGGFGYNQGPDAEGVANLEGNWWGTPLGTDFAINFTQSINGVAPENLPELIVLDTGDDDANITPPFGNTPFEFFAFQPALVGPPVTLADLDALLGFPVDLFTILIDPRGPLSDLSRPGGAQFFTNELGEPFQVTTFSDSFSIGELAGPGGLQPAAGGGTGEEEEEEAEGEGESQEEGGQQGPVNLGDLQPAAGPGSQQALNEDTCVATFFGDFWNAAAACQ